MVFFFTLTLTTAGSTEFAMFPPVGIGIKLAKEEKREKKKKKQISRCGCEKEEFTPCAIVTWPSGSSAVALKWL